MKIGLTWLAHINSILRQMRVIAAEGARILSDESEEKGQISFIKKTLNDAFEKLILAVPEDFPNSRIGDLQRHIRFSERGDYFDMLHADIPDIEAKAEQYVLERHNEAGPVGFEDLLHPIVRDAALRHYRNKDFRVAIFEGIVAVFDQIRERTGLTADGDALITQTFSVSRPLLEIADLSTDSGRNEQLGFMMLCQGAAKNIRNPKAHSRQHNLDAHKAAQNLVFISLLARIITQARSCEQARIAPVVTGAAAGDNR